jgi:aldose 1-epimerase
MAMSRSTTTLLMCLLAVAVVSLGGAEARRQQGKGTLGFYELRRGEFSMVVTNWGATILSVRLPDQTGTCNVFLLYFLSLLLIKVGEMLIHR